MNSRRLLMMTGLLAVLVILAVAPVVAQDEGAGGVIIEGTFASDPDTFNPLMAGDTVSVNLANLMFPGLIAVDPSRAVIVPRAEAPEEFTGGTLVDSWEISEDGRTYTFNMRQDYTWSDGTPVTTADIAYAWEAIQAGAEGVADVPAAYVVDFIDSVEIVDDYTFTVTFNQPTCTALNYAASLGAPLAPSHALGPVEQLNDDPFNLQPTVFGGPMQFGEFRPGEQTSLLANTEYPDAPVMPTGYILRIVPDSTVLVEQFLSGEIGYIDNPQVSRRADIRAAAAESGLQVVDYPSNLWDYLALNFADPTNPQNGTDENGDPVEQGHHPLFGDPRVRRAVALGIDVNAIIDTAVFGEGERMTSFIIPASWAYNEDLPTIQYDPDAAAALLEEAGWIDDDNDPSTPRVAQGALHAEDGTPLSFSLFTNEGNARREAASTVIQNQLEQIGFDVNFQTIDFNVLIDMRNAQTFDAVLMGWQNSYPDDPDVTQLFTPTADVVTAGANFTSYNNPEFTELNRQANDATETNNCDIETRAELYREMQEIFQEDLPYIPLYSQNGMYAAQGNIANFNPYPAAPYWNFPSWAVTTP